MWTYNGKVIREGRAWTDDNGTQHPANWQVWSADEKTSKGLVWTDPVTPPDSRFYRWHQNADGTITSTPKELEDRNEVDDNGQPILDENGKQLVTKGLKSQFIQEVKTQQASILSQTDWAYVRKADTNIDVPADIQLWRNEIRLAASVMEDGISQATTIQDMENLMVKYTANPDGTVTKTGMLFDWPEKV